MVKTKPKISEEEQLQKQQEFKILSKKYFIKQKIIEVVLFIVIVALVLGFATALGYAVSLVRPDIVCLAMSSADSTHTTDCVFSETLWTYLGTGIYVLFALCVAAVVLFVIVSLIYYILSTWIKKNWVLAESRARLDLGIIVEEQQADEEKTNKKLNVTKVVEVKQPVQDSYY